ncbi:DUF1801 domain-containing protein [Sediminitomix flava]|uniref:Uncharacterized protein DUF1801 n=1 Tax=Sediminitomix flava TaxID=379075 RepID=A0A315ZA76_SEDFL|nr:DUF1801 domain-containing protein [Sediminitomix flava]PWJ41963.1 uncharacterized protein DUF1801 [Sediminitomix flava]
MHSQKIHHLDEFIDLLTDEHKQIFQFLKNLIETNLPQIEERISYNVPFYFRHKRICYIWPSSIPWGGVKTGVALGICAGIYLSNEQDLMTFEKRKEMGKVIFQSLEEVQEKQASIIELLKEAYYWDELQHNLK